MSEFFRTGMGQTFFNRTLPAIAEALTDIAKELKELNATIKSIDLTEIGHLGQQLLRMERDKRTQ